MSVPLLACDLLHKLRAETHFEKDEIMARFGLPLFIGSDSRPAFISRVTECISAVLGPIGNYIVLTILKVQDK